MSRPRIIFMCKAVAVAAAMIAIPLRDAAAQRRDYLTEPEVQLVRENQQIDLRIGVLTQAARRRLEMLVIGKPSRKEREEWGELPAGTPLQLMSDIDAILEKAVSDIDDAADRKVKGELFNKAVFKLADFCSDEVPKLSDVPSAAADRGKPDSLFTSISERCSEIMSAATRLPRNAKDPRGGKKP